MFEADDIYFGVIMVVNTHFPVPSQVLVMVGVYAFSVSNVSGVPDS